MKGTGFERKYRYALVICTNSGVSDYTQNHRNPFSLR